MSVTITKRPLLPVITVQKNTTGVYTFNPLTGVRDLEVVSAVFEPPYMGVGGQFTIKAYVTGSAQYDAIDNGAEVTMWAGKTDASKVKVMLGTVTHKKIITESKNEAYLELSGMDWGSWLLKGRVLNYYLKQRVNSDGTPDETDNSTVIQSVIYDMLTNPRWYPQQDLTIQDQGVTVSLANIEIPATVKIAEFGANMEYADDKFKELAAVVDAYHYVDEDKAFRVKQPSIIDSGILLTDNQSDSVALTWDQTKVGLISGESPSTFDTTIENYMKRLYGVGSSRALLESTQSVASASDTLYNTYRAVKLNVTQIRPQYIGVYVDKVGSPPQDLTLELREDKANTPNGALIREVAKAKGNIGTTAGWHYFDFSGELLNSAVAYWIVLRPAGSSTANTYRWYRGGSGYTVASSTNGSTWTVTSSTSGYAYEYRHIDELRSVLENDVNVVGGNANFPEGIIHRPDVKDDTTFDVIMASAANQAFYEKQTYQCTVYSPDTLLRNGQKVRVRVQNSAVNFDYSDFVVSNLAYIFDAANTPDGTMLLDVELSRVAR